MATFRVYFTFSVICTRHTVSSSQRILPYHFSSHFLLSILEKDLFLFTKDCVPLRRLSSVKLLNLWPQGFEDSIGTISQFVCLFFSLSHALCKIFATKILIFHRVGKCTCNQATNCPLECSMRCSATPWREWKGKVLLHADTHSKILSHTHSHLFRRKHTNNVLNLLSLQGW